MILNRVIHAEVMVKRLIIFFAVLVTLSSASMLMATSAHASSPEICAALSGSPISPCMNKWNNGALVKSYSPGGTNEKYEIQSLSGGGFQIFDPNTGDCVGDYLNNSGDAKASDLDSCPSSGTAGWGTVYDYNTTGVNGCQRGSGLLYNRHWAGYASGAAANGSQWYLNNVSGNAFCVEQF